MSIVRGGLSGLLDQIAFYLNEKAKCLRDERKHARRSGRTADASPKKQRRALLEDARRENVRQAEEIDALKRELGERELAEPRPHGPAAAANAAQPKPPAAPVSDLEREVAEFAATMDELKESLGGRLPGEPEEGASTVGNNLPGLAGGATPTPFAPPKKAPEISHVESRMLAALREISDVPWDVASDGDVIIVRAPSGRASTYAEDARKLSEAFGVPCQSPTLFILPARRAIFLDQLELRVKAHRQEAAEGPPQPVEPVEAIAPEPPKPNDHNAQADISP